MELLGPTRAAALEWEPKLSSDCLFEVAGAAEGTAVTLPEMLMLPAG